MPKITFEPISVPERSAPRPVDQPTMAPGNFAGAQTVGTRYHYRILWVGMWDDIKPLQATWQRLSFVYAMYG